MSSKNSLLASHRSQLAELETEMDEEAREELEKLRDDMAVKIRSQITNVRHKLHADLNNKGNEFLEYIPGSEESAVWVQNWFWIL